jgi:hypothetical protein
LGSVHVHYLFPVICILSITFSVLLINQPVFAASRSVRLSFSIALQTGTLVVSRTKQTVLNHLIKTKDSECFEHKKAC